MKLFAKILNVLFALLILFGTPHYLERPSLYAGTWIVSLFIFLYLDDAIDVNIK